MVRDQEGLISENHGSVTKHPVYARCTIIRGVRPIASILALASILTACAGSPEPRADVGSESESSVTTAASETTTSDPQPEEALAEDLPDFGPVPALEDVDGWLQSDITSLEQLRGKVVVVQFWTFGCHNCKATLPNLQALYTEHAGDEFEIVGIHSPEFDYEEDPEAIATAAEDLGVSWPIVLDTRQRTFFAWQGSPAYWPRTYVLDRDGSIRFDHIGEGAYEELNDTVAELLG